MFVLASALRCAFVYGQPGCLFIHYSRGCCFMSTQVLENCQVPLHRNRHTWSRSLLPSHVQQLVKQFSDITATGPWLSCTYTPAAMIGTQPLQHRLWRTKWNAVKGLQSTGLLLQVQVKGTCTFNLRDGPMSLWSGRDQIATITASSDEPSGGKKKKSVKWKK